MSPKHNDLLARIDEAIAALPRPVTVEQVKAAMSDIVKPQDLKAHGQFVLWLDKHGPEYVELVNGRQ